jgi:hypothetical protein
VKHFFKYTILLTVLFLFTILAPVYGEHFKKHGVSIPLRFDYYYSYDMVNEALEKLHKAYPRLTQLDLVGKSEEGRSIFCMTVNNPATGKELEKPGIYVDANIHGNEIQGAEVALYLLDYLLSKYGDNKEITQLVDKNCFYVVPVVNVDGRYHFIEDGQGGENRSLRVPYDDDRDGLVDEDFAEDLDGDGNICRMRKRDPHGLYKTDPEEPRLMVRIKPGEKGEWTRLGSEGIDNDGDGQINEDEEGYLDPNRNFGFEWMPRYIEGGSGDYPLSATGLKALAEYIRQRPNICMSWALHNNGGMFLRGPSSKTEAEYPVQDIEVYDYLGRQSERIIPGYRYLLSVPAVSSTYGDFTEWMVMINGCYGFVSELYMIEQEQFRTIAENTQAEAIKGISTEIGENDYHWLEGKVSDRERLKFNDYLVQGELFKPWKPFKHPTYGDIEIGGWVKMSTRLPAPFMLKEMVHRNAMTIIFSAGNTPEVNMDILEIAKTGPGLYRIDVRLENKKAIPTMSYHAQQVNLYPRDMLMVSGKDIKVAAGGVINNIYTNEVSYKEHRPEIQFFTIPGFGKVEYRFLVTGQGTVDLTYTSRHAGKITRSVSLQ